MHSLSFNNRLGRYSVKFNYKLSIYSCWKITKYIYACPNCIYFKEVLPLHHIINFFCNSLQRRIQQLANKLKKALCDNSWKSLIVVRKSSI